jgi:hypothetical protein
MCSAITLLLLVRAEQLLVKMDRILRFQLLHPLAAEASDLGRAETPVDLGDPAVEEMGMVQVCTRWFQNLGVLGHLAKVMLAAQDLVAHLTQPEGAAAAQVVLAQTAQGEVLVATGEAVLHPPLLGLLYSAPAVEEAAPVSRLDLGDWAEVGPGALETE